MIDMPYDAIVVLGARVQADGAASDALTRRLTLALNCYEKLSAPIICCGAQGRDEPCTEAAFMRDWLIARGVPEEMVIPEDRSYDTLQNIANTKAIMDAKGFARAFIITSDYHLRRALAICRRYHLDATGAGSPSDKRYWLKNHARELLAWGKFYLSLFIRMS